MDRIAKFLILLVAAVVLVPGCFADETVEAAATPTIEEVVEVAEVAEATDAAGNETVVEEAVEEVVEEIIPDFTANETVTLLENVGVNQTVAIALSAEEADGIWNVTMSEGLEQVGNSTITEEGAEEFIIKALTAGTQSFSAIHEGAATEAGETYTLEIIVA